MTTPPSRGRTALVRAATLEDLPAISALGSAAFVAAFGAANPPGVVDDYVAEAFSVETLGLQLGEASSRWFVAEGDGGLLGMAHLTGGVCPADVMGDAPVQLRRLYTAAGLTSRGVGSLLMETVIDAASGAGHDLMWLGVWEHNPRAIAFYERWGFEQVGTVEFRLGDEDQTDLVLSRPLRS